MTHRPETPAAGAAAADLRAAAAAAAGDDGGAGGAAAGGGGDVDAHSFPPDTESHRRAQVVCAPHTLRSPPPTSRGC